MNELITIVVPIYNVEKYLKQCLESLISQTYKNIEIILINDGSTDGSKKICEEFTKKDTRIIVINQKNSGLSAARNTGIDNAMGKYITFVDADDYVSNYYIEKLYNAIKKQKSQIAQCDIQKVDSNGKFIKKMGYEQETIKTYKDMIIDMMNDMHWIENVVVWNKIYEIGLFKNIKFPLNKIHEDEFVTYKLYYLAKKISIVNESLYYYRQTNNSIMEKKYKIKNLDGLEAIKERMNFFYEENEKDLHGITIKFYIEQIRVNYIKLKKYVSNSKKICMEIKKEYNKYYLKCLINKYISHKIKITALFFLLFPNVFYKLKKDEY